MNKSIIINAINDKIKSLDTEKNSIIVLKGIPVNVVDSTMEKINLADIIDNKLKYFMSIIEKRKYISYEEFIFF